MNSHNRRKLNNPTKKKIQADDLHKILPKKMYKWPTFME